MSEEFIEQEPTVEAPAEETTTVEEPAQEENQETPEEAAERAETESKPWYRKKFDKLTWEREEVKRQLEAERQERLRMAELVAKLAPQQKEEPAPPRVEFPELPPIPPDRYQFDTDAEYSQAVAQFQAENARFVQGQIFRAQQQAQEQASQVQRQQQIAQGMHGLIAKGAQTHPDFTQVAFVPRGLEDVFIAAENGAEVAYFLGKNPAELQRITALSPAQAAFELAKIDAKLSVKAPTKAPPPINPVGGQGSGEKDPDKMTVEEWMKWRNSQLNQ